jgi:hypothetical protein
MGWVYSTAEEDKDALQIPLPELEGGDRKERRGNVRISDILASLAVWLHQLDGKVPCVKLGSAIHRHNYRPQRFQVASLTANFTFLNFPTQHSKQVQRHDKTRL